jgi:hypothetical protein
MCDDFVRLVVVVVVVVMVGSSALGNGRFSFLGCKPPALLK